MSVPFPGPTRPGNDSGWVRLWRGPTGQGNDEAEHGERGSHEGPSRISADAALGAVYCICGWMNGSWSRLEMTTQVGSSARQTSLALAAFQAWSLSGTSCLLRLAAGCRVWHLPHPAARAGWSGSPAESRILSHQSIMSPGETAVTPSDDFPAGAGSSVRGDASGESGSYDRHTYQRREVVW
jgi:hypothetical protein